MKLSDVSVFRIEAVLVLNGTAKEFRGRADMAETIFENLPPEQRTEF
jgi:hypothetical protein